MPEHRPRYGRPVRAVNADGTKAPRPRSSDRAGFEVGAYRRLKLTAEEQTRRAAARRLIIQRANQWMASRRGVAPFGGRHIQQAVRLVRHRGLVDDILLAVAGFGPA